MVKTTTTKKSSRLDNSRYEALYESDWLQDDRGLLHYGKLSKAQRVKRLDLVKKVACGQSLFLFFPDTASREIAPRCPLCCVVLSLPYGDGACGAKAS